MERKTWARRMGYDLSIDKPLTFTPNELADLLKQAIAFGVDTQMQYGFRSEAEQATLASPIIMAFSEAQHAVWAALDGSDITFSDPYRDATPWATELQEEVDAMQRRRT